MITTRRATSGDLSLFRDIRLESLKDSPDAFGTTYQQASARDLPSWEEQLLSSVDGSLRNMQFAFRDGACVGIASLYRGEGSPEGDIIMMWVSPDARGTNAATLLVESLIAWARDVGFEQVSLCVTDSNHRAIRLYEKCGFTATGETVDVDSNRNLTGIRMSMRLGS